MGFYQFNVKCFVYYSTVILFLSCSKLNTRFDMMSNLSKESDKKLILDDEANNNIDKTFASDKEQKNNDMKELDDNNDINTIKNITEEKSDDLEIEVNSSSINQHSTTSSVGNPPDKSTLDNLDNPKSSSITAPTKSMLHTLNTATRTPNVSMCVNIDLDDVKTNSPILKLECNENKSDSDNSKSFNLLIKAIKDRIDDNIIMYIAKNTCFINQNDEFGKHPIDYTSRTSSIYKKLKNISAESSIDKKMIQYTKEGNIDELRKLESSEEEYLLLRDNSSNTLLHIACKNSKSTIALFLLDRYPALINSLNNNKETPLECAIKAQINTTAKLLLEKGGVVKSKYKITHINSIDKFKSLHSKFAPREVVYQADADSDDSLQPIASSTIKNNNASKSLRYSTKEDYKKNYRKISKQMSLVKDKFNRIVEENDRYQDQLELVSMQIAINEMVHYDKNHTNSSSINNIKCFGETSLQRLCTLRGHSDIIKDFDFSFSKTHLISASLDGTLKLWRLHEKPHLSKTYTCGGINCIDFGNYNNSSFVSLDDKSVIKVWDINEDLPIINFNLTGGKWDVSKICYSPNRELLAGYGNSKNIVLYDSAFKNKTKIETNYSKVSALCFSTDSKFMAISDYSQKVDIWNILKKQIVFSIEKTMSRIENIFYSPDGKRLLVAGHQNFQIWNISNKSLVYDINVNSVHKNSEKRYTSILSVINNVGNKFKNNANSTKAAVNSNTIAATTKDGCISFFRLSDSKFIRKHPTQVYSHIDNLKFGGNKYIAASGISRSNVKNNNIIKIWTKKD